MKRDSFDLIISDVLIPGMDGFQLCRECKRQEALRKIPVFFYTSTYTDERDEMLAIGVGAEAFIKNPIESESFLQIIKSILVGKRKDLPVPSRISLKQDQTVYLKKYNQWLVKRLEKKSIGLKNSNRHLREFYSNLNSQTGEKSLTFELDVPDDFPPVRPDKKRLTQILFNLAGNVIKFTEDGKYYMCSLFKRG